MSEKEQHQEHQQAIALKYEQGNDAPRILATGAGEIARRIIALAQASNIPIHKDTTLTEILSQLDLSCEIPAETYQVVAQVLAFLYRCDLAWEHLCMPGVTPRTAIEKAPSEQKPPAQVRTGQARQVPITVKPNLGKGKKRQLGIASVSNKLK